MGLQRPGALAAPVDTLLSTWAFMVMASLAWSLKAWMALLLPSNGPLAAKKQQRLRMEFTTFRRAMQEKLERGPDASSLPRQGLRVGAEAEIHGGATPERVRAFLADDAPDRRRRLWLSKKVAESGLVTVFDLFFKK